MKHLVTATTLLLVLTFVASTVVLAQTTITGTVVDDASGDPLPGVAVIVQGSNIGTTTDNSGQYSIPIRSADDVLVFRFLGFDTQQLSIPEGATTLDVRLAASTLGLGEVVVVGTRRLPRLVKDSVVPVDVLSPADLASASSTDIDEVLKIQIPSYNVQRHGIDDEATLVRPTTLRGLPADNVIVLVNGKRRHRSGSIALLGSSLNTGAQGVDLNMIPSIALKQVELLRDGASAHYGSDAVAGVFNFQLRDASDGLMVRMQGGQYLEGDGEYAHVAANVGLPLTQRGFVNISLDFREAAPTIRSEQRADAQTLAGRGYPVANPSQIWGSPDVDNAWTGFVNAGIDLGSSVHAYAFGGWGQRTSEGGFYFRAPGTSSARGSVFRFGSGGSAQRAIVDLDQNDEVDCRNHPDLPSLDSDKSAVDAFIASTAGDCWMFNERFPGGFTPRFGADISDLSLVAGVRGETRSGFTWDLYFSGANSTVDYFIYNTINASYGPDTPTSFKPRSYIQDEISTGVNLTYPIKTGFLASPLGLAWGAEWRSEAFESKAGDEASWNPGPYGLQGFSVGSNGYQGLNPRFAGQWTRPNYAFYVDLEADVTDRLVLDVAARYEDFYESFGNTITGKIAGLYRLNDRASLRGTLSTGFRAPSPGQAHLQIFQTAFSGDGNLLEVGQVPSTHPIAMGLGGTELQEETAQNFTVGGIFELTDELDLTIDYFDIAIQDRIALTGSIALTDEISEIINDQPDIFGGVRDLREIRFFANDFDTRTRGIDLLLDWRGTWDNGQETNATIAWNWTQTTLEAFSPPQNINEFLGVPLRSPVEIRLLTRRRQIEMEELNPKNRFVANARHTFGKIHGMIRVNWYDGWQACRFGNNTCGDDLLDTYTGNWLFGGEVGYSVNQGAYRIALGVHNIFNTVKDAHPDETAGQGNSRPESMPWDYNGTAWYLRLTADLF